MYLKDLSLQDYINEVDSISSAPGGGSVAGLVGALGVSLAKMLAHFSLEKKKFIQASKKKQDRFVLAMRELDHYKDSLIGGIDEDAISYNAIIDAYKTKDENTIQSALNSSAYVAYEMQMASFKALEYLPLLIELGNKNLYSDLISGAILLNATCRMCSLNVIANANLITDELIKKSYLDKANELVINSSKLEKKIIKKINGK